VRAALAALLVAVALLAGTARADTFQVLPANAPTLPSFSSPNTAGSIALPGSFLTPPVAPMQLSYTQLLGIWQRAGASYGIKWQVLAAINKVESNFGRNMGPSSAGAIGWMQFMPSTWLRWGTDANGDGIADDDVIFDPTLCATQTVTENEDHAVDVTAQLVRFDDDPCASLASQSTFAAAQAAHAGETIVGIFVTQGFSGGHDASAQVRNLTVNANTFAFDVPPAPGVVLQTQIVQVPVPVPAGAQPTGAVLGVQVSKTCRGATVRRIHAPRRRGERFLRVNAALQTATGLRSLRARGRTVTVDLRSKPEANYNVRLISRYRTKHGHVRRVVTRRNLSVACS
jgi:hypothetical protein